jgi:hypothetical protein
VAAPQLHAVWYLRRHFSPATLQFSAVLGVSTSHRPNAGLSGITAAAQVLPAAARRSLCQEVVSSHLRAPPQAQLDLCAVAAATAQLQAVALLPEVGSQDWEAVLALAASSLQQVRRATVVHGGCMPRSVQCFMATRDSGRKRVNMFGLAGAAAEWSPSACASL